MFEPETPIAKIVEPKIMQPEIHRPRRSLSVAEAPEESTEAGEVTDPGQAGDPLERYLATRSAEEIKALRAYARTGSYREAGAAIGLERRRVSALVSAVTEASPVRLWAKPPKRGKPAKPSRALARWLGVDAPKPKPVSKVADAPAESAAPQPRSANAESRSENPDPASAIAESAAAIAESDRERLLAMVADRLADRLAPSLMPARAE